MLLSDDEEAIKKAVFWSTQARDTAPWYQHSELGYNYRMSNVVAGIARGQLIHLDEHRQLKKNIYNKYKEDLKDLPIIMNPYLECSEPNFWLSCLYIDKTKTSVTPMDILNKLNEANVESRPIWKPMHMQPIFEENDFITVEGSMQGKRDMDSIDSISNKEQSSNPYIQKGEFTSVVEDIFVNGLCLPSDIKMDEKMQDYVINVIKQCFE